MSRPAAVPGDTAERGQAAARLRVDPIACATASGMCAHLADDLVRLDSLGLSRSSPQRDAGPGRGPPGHPRRRRLPPPALRLDP